MYEYELFQKERESQNIRRDDLHKNNNYGKADKETKPDEAKDQDIPTHYKLFNPNFGIDNSKLYGTNLPTARIILPDSPFINKQQNDRKASVDSSRLRALDSIIKQAEQDIANKNSYAKA